MNEERETIGKEKIFIVGASRSGTTMMSKILSQHPNVYVTKETHYFDDLRPKLSNKLPTPLTTEQRRRCEDYFLRLGHRRYALNGDPEKSRFSREELRGVANEIGTNADAYFEAFCRLQAHRAGKGIWGEKTPRHVFRISEILEVFPDAHIICMVRDPRAVVASYRDWKKQGNKLDLEHDPEGWLEHERADERVRKSYNILLQSMLWRSMVSAAVTAQERFGPQRVRLLRYEDLINAPETQVRDIASWLNLDYHADMLEVPISHSSSSQNEQSKGLSAEPVNRWRKKLSNTEVGLIQASCGQILTDAGYEREPIRTPYMQLVWNWAMLPFATGRAAAVNYKRIGNLPAFIWRRLRGLLTIKNYRRVLQKNLAK